MSPASDSLLAMVAKLYYLEQLPQDEVARIVRLSQSKVSRLLSLARKRGIVRIAVDDSCLRNRDLEAQLRRVFNLRQTVVVTSVEGPHADVVTGHGCALASDIAQTLAQYETIGVTGGRTLSHFIRALRRRPGPAAARIVPLMGHVGPQASAVDAVDLCRILARKLGGEAFVINAPAYASDAGSRRLFMSHSDMRAVWQLFAQMQVALVGVGVIDDLVIVERGMLQPWDAHAVRIQGAVGEIAGRFFDRDGCECSTDFRDRVIGIELDALRRIPEVIGVTHGSGRSEAVVAAIRGGLLKSLVIDEEGAVAMLAQTPELERPIAPPVNAGHSVARSIATSSAEGTATAADDRQADRAHQPRSRQDKDTSPKDTSAAVGKSPSADVRRLKQRAPRRARKN